MIIRKAKSGDLKDIAEIYRKAYSESPYYEKWNRKMALERVRDELEDGKIYVAEVEKKIAGFIAFSTYEWFDGRWGYIDDFAMLKEYRGRGIGKMLMKKVEDDLRKTGVRTIDLRVHRKAKAFNMYKKLKYKENGYIDLEKKL
jgi:ribosomal protein S18 acetylase RimI-like enzyme